MFVCFVLVISLSRRILPTMCVLRSSPRQPDFEGLEAFLRHTDQQATGQLRTPAVDRWAVEQQKTEAMITKQARLVKEESQLRRGGGGGGGGGGAGGGDGGGQADPKKKAKGKGKKTKESDDDSDGE